MRSGWRWPARWTAWATGWRSGLTAAAGSAPPEREDDGEFVGLMMLPPAHGPDQPDDPTVADLGYRLVRRYWRQGPGQRGVPRPAAARLRHRRAEPGDRADHGGEPGSRGVMEAIGMRYVRTYFPSWDDPLPGADSGEVEYEMTRAMWTASRDTLRPAQPRPMYGGHAVAVQSRWLTMLITLPSGARTKNRRTPHGSVVIGCTIS